MRWPQTTARKTGGWPDVRLGSRGYWGHLFIGLGLQKEGSENLNVRAAMLHVFGDVGASVAVVVSGLIILLTGWYPADPLLSLVIAVLIARGAWKILHETVDILMEATPKNLNVAQLVRVCQACWMRMTCISGRLPGE